LQVGTYTSPHLRRWTERIVVNTIEIPVKTFIETVEQLFDVAKAVNATVFELVTAVAFAHFANSQVDIAIIEVGLGGRFDATNMVNSIVTALTSVDVDHTNYLGSDVEKIAWEKVGIAKPNIPMVSAMLEPNLQTVVEHECESINTPLKWAHSLKQRLINLEQQTFDSSWGEISIKSLGIYQSQNLSTAVGILDELGFQFDLDRALLKEGLQEVQWPARFEIFNQNPLWILDGAHNPSGAKAFRQSLEQVLESNTIGKRWLLFGIRADKDVKSVADALFPWFDQILFTQLPETFGVEPSALRKYAQQHRLDSQGFEDIGEALEYLDRHANDEDVICVAGSLVLVGEVRWRRLTEQR
jgi:dihydrofolate synthase/folylpolyglutamate synthase